MFAHPALHKSRVNSKLYDTVADIDGITLNDLYEEYPDFHIDVEREQKLLLSHDIIVWQHPFYWYSAPSIVKEWIDLVLEHGFAYGHEGNALNGKSIFSAITAGGSREAYTGEGKIHCTIQQLLLPYERTAKLCKMNYLPPFVIYGTHLKENEDIDKNARAYRQVLETLRDNKVPIDDIMRMYYLNELIKEKTNS